jgi:hypothetical protein
MRNVGAPAQSLSQGKRIVTGSKHRASFEETSDGNTIGIDDAGLMRHE